MRNRLSETNRTSTSFAAAVSAAGIARISARPARIALSRKRNAVDIRVAAAAIPTSLLSDRVREATCEAAHRLRTPAQAVRSVRRRP
jgi:hypothetical protein